MNQDPRFLRTRMRRLLPFLAAEGFDAAMLAGTATRLAVAADAIDAAVDRLIAVAVVVDAFAVAALDPGPFFPEPEEIRRRLLSRLLIAVGGEPYPPRFERLETLHAAIAAHPGGRFKRTLGGAVVEWRRGRFAIYRESGRAGLPDAEVGPGYFGVWDHRFEVRLDEAAPEGLRLAALGEDGRRAVAAGARDAPPGAIAALPALWRGAALIAVPVLVGGDGAEPDFAVAFRQIVGDRLNQPPRFPEFGPD